MNVITLIQILIISYFDDASAVSFEISGGEHCRGLRTYLSTGIYFVSPFRKLLSQSFMRIDNV